MRNKLHNTIFFTLPEEQEEQFSNDKLDIDNNSSAELNY